MVFMLQNSLAENAHIPIIMEQVLTDVLVTDVPGLNGLNSYTSQLVDMIRPFLIQRLVIVSTATSSSLECFLDSQCSNKVHEVKKKCTSSYRFLKLHLRQCLVMILDNSYLV